MELRRAMRHGTTHARREGVRFAECCHSRVFVQAGIAGIVATILASCGCAAGTDEPVKPAATEPVHKHAVLVGVTKYDHIPGGDLPGTENDADLIRRLLIDKFAFAADGSGIVSITESAAKENPRLRPTRENIVREIKALADPSLVRAGDQVVLYLAGHGSQQPDEDGDEPDGLDEIFLPADAIPSTRDAKCPNAIVDDELRVWVGDITKTGADVWVIVDACYSGTILRGTEREIARRIDPEKLVSRAALEKARADAAERNQNAVGPPPQRPAWQTPGAEGHLAVTTAAQSTEPTVELDFADSASSGAESLGLLEKGTVPAKEQWHGIFTYNLCKVLQESNSPRPLTYRELVLRIQQEYAAIGRDWPTPLAEGTDLDREVLGQKVWPGRSRITLKKEDGVWSVNAGQLHGLTKESILAVYPPPGTKGADTIVGYVRVSNSGPVRAAVAACDYPSPGGAILPRKDDLPTGGRCEVEYVDYGDLRLKLGLEFLGDPPADRTTAVRAAVEKLAEGKETPVAIVPSAAAQWRLQTDAAGSWLVRGEGGIVVADRQARGVSTRNVYGPYSAERVQPSLEKLLPRIARYEMLRKIAATQPNDSGGLPPVRVEVDLVKYRDKTDRQGATIPWTPDLRLQAGDLIAFRIRNLGQNEKDKCYVTLLFLDSDFGISAIYPSRGDVAEAFAPLGSALTYLQVMNAKSTGREHLVVLAVRAEGPAVDFSGFAQDNLGSVRDVSRGASDSPLGKLLESGLFKSGSARGVTRGESGAFATQIHSWETVSLSSTTGEKP